MSMKLNHATMYALNRKLKANSLFQCATSFTD